MMKRNRSRLKIIIAFSMFFAVGIFIQYPKTAQAASATFIVNSVNDGVDANNGDGVCETSTASECTLRAAIEQANTNGNPSDQDKITFNIAGTGLHTITTSAQFTISESLEVDGYTQSGAVANLQAWPAPFDGTLTIEVDSSGIPNNYNAFSIDSDNVTFKGLIVNGSPTSEFYLNGTRNNISFYGNYIGTDSSGLVKGDSKRCIFGADGGSGLVVGGNLPTERNVIACEFSAISTELNNTTIQGNYIGVGADGVTPLPTTISMNAYLIDLYGNNALIGGTGAGEGNSIENNNNFAAVSLNTSTNSAILGNRISGNHGGINISGDSSGTQIGDGTTAGRNVISGNDILGADINYPLVYGNAITLYNSGSVAIQGNYIGVAEDGTTALGNGSYGILAMDCVGLIIGGTGAGEGNIIANSGLDGIHVQDATSRVSILGNSLYANGGLGIDIAPNGVNQNDMLDPDTGPNDLLNFPKLFPGVINGANTDITYRVDVPAGEYRVEFYSNNSADPTGYGEGQQFIGFDGPITSNGSGVQQFSTTLVGNTHDNIYATITEVDALSVSGYGPTSEYSDFAQEDVDAEVTKTVVDQSTITTSGTIQYEVTYTNNGTDPINPTLRDASGVNPLNTALFNDIFPANLTFTSVTGDADCSIQNNAATFGTLFSNHGAFTVLSCGYSGVDTALEFGESLSFTLTFSVVNPLQTVFTNYTLSVPTGFDPETTAYTAAVNSGEDIIDELGTNINNLSSATTTKPVTDVSLTKELTNPEDVAQGATLNYQFTYTNNGPDVLNLAEFNGAPPLLLDILHPDLTPSDLGAPGPFPDTFYISDTGNADIVCLWAGPGSVAAFLPSYTNHLDYGVISCLYVGADTVLEDDSSLQMDLNFTVANDSELAFTNYSLVTAPTASEDPDQDDLTAVDNSGNDPINEMTSQYPSLNNFAMAELPADIDVSAELENTGDISPSDAVYYNVTLTNNGNTGIDLTTYNNFSTKTLIASAYAAEDITIVGSTTANVVCGSAGPGSIAYLNNGGTEHPDYQLLICAYTGPSQIIAPGDSFTVRLQFTADNDVSNSFNFYSLQGSVNGDPDLPSLYTDLYGATEDVLDTLVNENYDRVAYVGSGATEDVVDNTLSDTGQNRKILAYVAVLVATIGSVMVGRLLFARRKNSVS